MSLQDFNDKIAHSLKGFITIGTVIGMVVAVWIGFWNVLGRPATAEFIRVTVNEQVEQLRKAQEEEILETARIRQLVEELQRTSGNRDTQITEMLRILHELEIQRNR